MKIPEPWTPKEGQRVRITLNPECPIYNDTLSGPPIDEGPRYGHHASFDGVTGTISWIWPNEGHRYRVETDDGRTIGLGYTDYCAAELASLAPTAEAGEGG